MRFLADESCDFAVVRALRAAGHDVAAIAEEQPGLTDQDVIPRAKSESRIVLAEDKDFGQLSFSAAGPSVASCCGFRLGPVLRSAPTSFSWSRPSVTDCFAAS